MLSFTNSLTHSRMPGVSDSLAVMVVGWGRRERIEIERKKEREKDRVSEREGWRESE